MINNPIKIFNEKLLSSLDNKVPPLGLAHGKMGICIYFYYLSRYCDNKQYKQAAEKLIDDVFENIDTISFSGIETGLSGIGLGIHYLIQNKYVEGDVNDILSDVDDSIFKELSKDTSSLSSNLPLLVQNIYYLCIRLETQKDNSESSELYKGLIIELVNILYGAIDSKNFENELYYSLNNLTPQILFVMAYVHRFNFYNYRINKILERLLLRVCSTIPISHANKLYLLWGLDMVSKQIENENCNKHIKLLKQEIDVNIILNKELRNKHVFFKRGYPGIWWLLHSLNGYFDLAELNTYKEQICKKIEESENWNWIIKEDKNKLNSTLGLLDGFCGTIITLTQLKEIKIL